MHEQGMINERMSNNERSTDQPPHNIAWEGDVYSQVLGNEKGGYVHGGLEQEITELKEKQHEEMNLMKQNHKKLQSELLQMRQFMQKYAPDEPFLKISIALQMIRYVRQ
ncbi:hypothetical protein H5410_056405 [Solanum commersonii]|uniref:Uncharacterized protein n=1 Tax=Solanum commersonii TaxID=4109 RepID=A0A9J5WM21_SOLCO|nr:hypothetical protein H5410_056405 [Solanum commersonii]